MKRFVFIALSIGLFISGCSGPKISTDPQKPTNPDSALIKNKLAKISRTEQISSSISVNNTLGWDSLLIAAPFLNEDYLRPHINLIDEHFLLLEKQLVKYQNYQLVLIKDSKILYIDPLTAVLTSPVFLVFDQDTTAIPYQTLSDRGMDEILLYSNDPAFNKAVEQTIISLNVRFQESLDN